MGNNPSKAVGGVPSSPAAGTATHSSQPQSQSQSYQRRTPPTRRDSIQTSSAATTAAAHASDPTSTLPSSLASPTTLTSKPLPQHYYHHHSPSHSDPSAGYSGARREDKMGNTQSVQAWREKSEVRRRERDPEQQSNPVRVPGSTQEKRQRGPDSQFEPSAPPRDPNYVSISNLNFPPRLPLPIQEEVYTPGSPIITPADINSVLNDDGDLDGNVPRRTSLLSHTTADDDEIDDDLQAYSLEGARGGTVPTRIEWKQGGDKVYITGTFASWSRKYRMHRDPSTNVLFTILDLPPGTHHVKFIVDGDMQLSNELPTAVDYTNILVNYVEVSADDIPRESPAVDKVPEGVFPPLVLPPGIESNDRDPAAVGKTERADGEEPAEPVYYGDNVPPYLLDLDREDDTRRFQRSANHIMELPPPPSLPLFLGKSILNGTTPMKDDSSVLNMPNHTVLNHLATSSIKAEVLATSLTTRYKRKYVTTIMYRPTDAGID